jgi:hypothetical protein
MKFAQSQVWFWERRRSGEVGSLPRSQRDDGGESTERTERSSSRCVLCPEDDFLGEELLALLVAPGGEAVV